STVTSSEVRPILRVSKAGMSCLLSSCQAVFYIRGYDRIRRRRVGAGGRVAKDQHITAHSRLWLSFLPASLYPVRNYDFRHGSWACLTRSCLTGWRAGPL